MILLEDLEPLYLCFLIFSYDTQMQVKTEWECNRNYADSTVLIMGGTSILPIHPPRTRPIMLPKADNKIPN
jgi:hypothetical protein